MIVISNLATDSEAGQFRFAEKGTIVAVNFNLDKIRPGARRERISGGLLEFLALPIRERPGALTAG